MDEHAGDKHAGEKTPPGLSAAPARRDGISMFLMSFLILFAGLAAGVGLALAAGFYAGILASPPASGLAPPDFAADFTPPDTAPLDSAPAQTQRPSAEDQRAAAYEQAMEEMHARLLSQSARQQRGEERLAFVEAGLEALPAPGTLAVKSEISLLKAELAQLESEQTGAVAAEEESREKALTELESRLGRPHGKDYALLGLALAQFRLAAAAGAYEGPLRQLGLILGDNPGFAPQLDALARHQAGAPSSAELAVAFAAPAGRAYAALPESGWPAWLASRLSRVVQLRPVSGMGAQNPAAALAQMDELVEAGELALALAAIEGLPSQARAALAEWESTARARVEIDTLSARFEQEVLALLALAGQDAPGAQAAPAPGG